MNWEAGSIVVLSAPVRVGYSGECIPTGSRGRVIEVRGDPPNGVYIVNFSERWSRVVIGSWELADLHPLELLAIALED